MTSPEEILLSAASEWANWARHYDTMRAQLVALILALSGAAVGFAINTADDKVRIQLLSVTALVGAALTFLTAEYTRLYYERSAAESELRQLATRFATHDKSADRFNHDYLFVKVYEGYFEAFDEDIYGILKKNPPKVSGKNCVKEAPKEDETISEEEKKARKEKEENCVMKRRMAAFYGGVGVSNWRYSMAPKVAFSPWLWLSLGVGFVLPLACLALGIRRHPGRSL